MTTLYVLRHGSTEETGRASSSASSGPGSSESGSSKAGSSGAGSSGARFPTATGASPEPPGPGLDADGRAEVRRLAAHLPQVDLVWSSHARRAVETATLALRSPDACLDLLAEASFGPWAGRHVREVHAEDPTAVARWMADPDDVPPGVETFTDVRRRAAAVLDRASATGGVLAAVTHGGMVRAMLAEVLRGPSGVAWALGVAPASVSVLEGGPDGWWQVRTSSWTPSLPGGPDAT